MQHNNSSSAICLSHVGAQLTPNWAQSHEAHRDVDPAIVAYHSGFQGSKYY